jgi:UMF1 family MFS transporter
MGVLEDSGVTAVPPEPRRGSARAIWSWALFDFANSPFTTLIVTFVYSTYFTKAIAPDEITGTALWSRAVTITALIVALSSPLLGALADRGGYRKLFVGICVAVCSVACFALYAVLPGQVLLALAIFVVANVAFEFAEVFYNAFLTDVAPPAKVGSVSGLGWGLGYIGGLVALVIALVTLVQPSGAPWFGFSTEQGENIRATNLLVAVWFVIFSVPLFLWVHEDKSRVSEGRHVLRDTIAQLKRTFAQLRKHRQTVRFLVARLFYNDGLVTVFAFGGIYAAATFGFSQAQVIEFGIAINLAAGISAVAMGYLDDWLGGKRTIVVSLIGLIAATLLAVFTTSATGIWTAGIAIGVFAGPNQAASRSLMARFVPADAENEFFGFFAFTGKLTAFIGPFFLGELTNLFESQRVGVSVVIVLFVLGLVGLYFVDEAEGSRVRAG